MYESIRAAQNPLFIESLEEAIAALAPVVGGKKKLAVLLRPDIDDLDTAHKWLLEVLSANPDRRAVFKADHLLRAIKIAKDNNVHFLKHWVDDFTGYERTSVAPPKTKNQQRAERMERLLAEFRDLAEEEAADLNQPNLKAVS